MPALQIKRKRSVLGNPLFWILLILLIGGIVALIIWVTSKEPAPSPPPPPPGPAPSKPTGPTRLYLYPEVNGYNITDFKGFPSPKVVEANFGGIAAIANSAGRKYNRDYTTLDNFWGPDDSMVEMWNKVEKNYPNMYVEKWIAYDFGPSSPFCSCNAKGCNGGPNIPPTCDQVATLIVNDIKKYKLAGILFDDEVGDCAKIVATMQDAVDKYKKDTNIDVKLGWSPDKELKNAGNDKGPRGYGNRKWNTSLAQAYTNDTLNLYSSSCNPSPNFWSNIDITMDGQVVPMVCGAGNCQGELSSVSSSKWQCIDERLSPAKLENLIKSRPPKFKNISFGIWYGTINETSPKGGCKMPNWSPPPSSPSACQSGCCDTWKI